jgi:hypothetical protein
MKETNEGDLSAQVTASFWLHSGMPLFPDDQSGTGKPAPPLLKTEAIKQNCFEPPPPIAGIISTNEKKMPFSNKTPSVSSVPVYEIRKGDRITHERRKRRVMSKKTSDYFIDDQADLVSNGRNRCHRRTPSDTIKLLPAGSQIRFTAFSSADILPNADKMGALKKEQEFIEIPNNPFYRYDNFQLYFFEKERFLVYFTSFLVRLYFFLFSIAITEFGRRYQYPTKEVPL